MPEEAWIEKRRTIDSKPGHEQHLLSYHYRNFLREASS